MFEVLHHASDDQMALVLCFGALVICGAVMHLSLPLAKMTRRVNGRTASTDQRLIAAPVPSEFKRRDKAA